MTGPSLEITPIGHVTSSFTGLTAVPSQASENPQSTGTVVLREDLVDALLGLDRYPFLWLVTWLHQGDDEPAPLRCVPRAKEAEGKIQGVFASRSPRRPNSIGLSLVRQLQVVDNTIAFAGVDLIDGTPVLDIKPWFEDCDLPSS
jgi:tRNA-Thr(GGU) m(6)t(6)A37 methyltransferase TsaA